MPPTRARPARCPRQRWRVVSQAPPNPFLTVRPEWLATCQEEILLPEQPIVDTHHHLFDRADWRYLLDGLLEDTGSGHRIVATVYVQARTMYRADGPEAMRPVGETEFANGVAAMTASGRYGEIRVGAGIVAFADFMHGAAVRPLLEAHLLAGGGPGGRLRGIRQITMWDADAEHRLSFYPVSERMMDTPDFRAGFAELAPLGLSFDACLHFPQLPELGRLARAFPETAIVLDHCGGLLGVGSYAGRNDENFAVWLAGMRDLARCPNVTVKLGGLGSRHCGFGFADQPQAPSSAQLAAAWSPWMTTSIELFGAERCMFESNFPVDKGSYSYAVGWNAMKRIAAGANADERDALFRRSAAAAYRLALPAG